jgi:hypothetical protein
MVHGLLDANNYIDLWLDTQLVYDIYLKNMEGDLSKIQPLLLDLEVYIFISTFILF